ncbi:MAG: DeoR family transcriptional regulator [Nitriliruptorales bacterium]|nr:DeoR family transcriptional regulator [Nitriliruptorales bacterium]
MYAEERQAHIGALARRDGRVDVATLAEGLDVTPETIRRDLTALERRGVLRRVHGGAIPIERLGFEPAFEARDTVMTAEKERIAKAALAELPEEGSVLLDAGSTTSRLAEVLPTDRELTVVTNALNIAVRLAPRPNITVLVLGGRVRGRTLAAVDMWALQALQDTFVDVGFMATNGVSITRGLTTPDPTEGAIKKAMIAASRRVVLVADHTKMENNHLIRFGSVDDVDTFVTDTGLDRELGVDLEATGVRVVRA